VKASTNRGRRCTGHALARHAETDLFRRFQYLTVPLHLFAQDRSAVLDAMNEAVSRLYAYERPDSGDAGTENRAA
jgi:hypothetical protein